MADPDLNALYDMYANHMSEGFEPQCMIVPSDRGPVMIFNGSKTGYLLDDEGNVTHEVQWEPNPEFWKDAPLER